MQTYNTQLVEKAKKFLANKNKQAETLAAEKRELARQEKLLNFQILLQQEEPNI